MIMKLPEITIPQPSAYADNCGILICGGCKAMVTPFNVPVGGTVKIANSDSSRQRIGFSIAIAGQTCSIQSAQLFNTTGGFLLTAGEILWLTPSEAAQLVQYDWYAFDIAATGPLVSVYELYV